MSDVLSPQTMFNTVVVHLATQGKRATCDVDKVSCRYRARGLKCAVGVLIPDEWYQSDMEGTLHSLLAKYPKLAHRFGIISDESTTDRNYMLLRDLQAIHDSWGVLYVDRTKIKTKLQKVGTNYGLNVDIVDQVNWNYRYD